MEVFEVEAMKAQILVRGLLQVSCNQKNRNVGVLSNREDLHSRGKKTETELT